MTQLTTPTPVQFISEPPPAAPAASAVHPLLRPPPAARRSKATQQQEQAGVRQAWAAGPPSDATSALLRAPQPLPTLPPPAGRVGACATSAITAAPQNQKDDDAVLIASGTPSYNPPAGQQGAAAPPTQLPCRSSQVGSDDRSPTALAAASRRLTGYSSFKSASVTSRASLASSGSGRMPQDAARSSTGAVAMAEEVLVAGSLGSSPSASMVTESDPSSVGMACDALGHAEVAAAQPAIAQLPLLQMQRAPQAADPTPLQPNPSPSKGGFLAKLAALRLGRSNSGVGHAAAGSPLAPGRGSGSGSGDNRALVDVPADQRAPVQPMLVSMRPALCPLDAGQPRYLDRSCLSVDGHALPPAAPPGPAAAVQGHAGGDALSNFQQQHAQQAVSPTVLDLGATRQEVRAGSGGGGVSSSSSSSNRGGGGAFAIPLRPTGGVLELCIRSTWGDPHYVGLAGLELFDAKGQLLSVGCAAVWYVA